MKKSEDEKITISFSKKKVFKFFEILVMVFIAINLIDLASVLIFNKPLLVLSVDKSKNQEVYKGLFYNSFDCADTKGMKIKSKFSKYACSSSIVSGLKLKGIIIGVENNSLKLELDNKESIEVSLDNNPTIIGSDGFYIGQEVSIDLYEELKKNVESITVDEINIVDDNKQELAGLDFTIIDNTSTCAQSLEKIYNDGMYDYFLPCVKSSKVFVKFSNGVKILMKEALARRYITPQDVLDKGYNLLKQAASKERGGFTILDMTGTCAQSLEKIYEDGEYEYFLSCQKSSTVYIRFDNGEIYTMKEALNKKLVTPDQIIKKKYNLIKEKKKIEGRGDFKIIDNVEACATAIEEVYKDGNYVYTLPCIKSKSVIVEFENGEKYNLNEALNKKIVTPDQVIAKGYKLGKKLIARGDFKVVDNAGTCAQSLEEIYRDKTYIYYLSCQKSGSVFIQFNNGEKYPIKEALTKSLVTPDQIINKGYKLIKKKIARGDFTIIDKTGSCAQSLEEIYRDKTYKYYLSCQKSSSVFVQFDNGEKYTMKVALSKGYVTPAQIINKKYNLIKKPIARGDFTIIDKVESCASAIEEVYRDSTYKYTLSCIKSTAVIIEFDNGERYTLKDALNKKIVTPTQIINKGYNLKKVPLARGDFKIVDNTPSGQSIQEIEEIYTEGGVTYYFSTKKSQYVFIHFDNGEIYNIKDALTLKYVTPAQIKAKGYTDLKSSADKKG